MSDSRVALFVRHFPCEASDATYVAAALRANAFVVADSVQIVTESHRVSYVLNVPAEDIACADLAVRLAAQAAVSSHGAR